MTQKLVIRIFVNDQEIKTASGQVNKETGDRDEEVEEQESKTADGSGSS